METLPLALVSSIVGFAVHDYEESILPDKLRFPTENMRVLALVSTSWFRAIRELSAQFQQSTLTFSFQTASREEVLAMRRNVLERGRQVTDFRVSMGEFGAFGEYFTRHRRLPRTLDTLEFGWDTVMANLPNLRRLDLAEMPFPSGKLQVKSIIESAAKFCVELEALILPGKELQGLRPGEEMEPLLEAVYAGMQRWCSEGNRGGLKQLKVPTVNEAKRFQSCKKFFAHVVAYCPHVEYLDGFKHSLCEMDRLTCQDAWPLTLADWEKLNATCTNLREFNWVVAPFGDAYFRVFGEHVKPRLTKLCFGINMLWDWPQYFLGCDLDANLLVGHNIVPVDRPGYGDAATDASTALRGCPALEEIEVALYHPLDEDERGDPFNRNAVHFPEHETVPMNIFNDHFWETLALRCPLVTRIALWEVIDGQDNDRPILTFTDRGLVALAKLKYLDFMELRPVSCTGLGLFEFLNRLSDEFTRQRTFQICVGGMGFGRDLLFYDAVMSLLVQVANTEPGALRMLKQKIVLRLRNANLRNVEADWSVNYLKSLKQQVARAKERHPSLRLRLTSQGFNGRSFHSIIELGMYSSHAEPSVWFGWDDEEKDRNVVFVNRGETPPPVEVFDEREGMPG